MTIQMDATAFGAEPINGEVVFVAGSQVAEISVGMEAAARRFMAVDEVGHEMTAEELVADDSDLYTPNYVSDVEVTSNWCQMYIDCKGNIVPAMRAKFTEILIEELLQHGVEDARVFSRHFDSDD